MAFQYKNALNLQGNAEQIQSAIRFIQKDENGPGSIDFDAITPIPQWVCARSDEQSKKKYGAENCMEGWMQKHWGVSANALGSAESALIYDGGPMIEFDTLGGDVRSLIQKLSMIFPTLYFDYMWSSGDVGKDSGMVQYKDGELAMEYLPQSGSSQAYEMCFDVNGKTAEDYGLVYDPTDSTYQYAGKLLQSFGEDMQDEIKKED